MKNLNKAENNTALRSQNNVAQKKYLASQKQLRVWLDAEKFEAFKSAASGNGTSMHRLINDFVDEYLEANGRTHSNV